MPATLRSIFGDIANAIRSKTEKTESITPINMASEIMNIESGLGNDYDLLLTKSNKEMVYNVPGDVSFFNIFNLKTWFNHKVNIPENENNVSYLFEDYVAFNQPLSLDNKEANYILKNAVSFNQPVTINNPKNMAGAFESATSFDKTVSIYGDTSELKDISYMFSNSSFNKSFQIPSSVTNVSSIFYNDTYFNQPITIPENVEDCSYMFCKAINFNQPIIMTNTVINYDYFLADTNFNSTITFPNNYRQYPSLYINTISYAGLLKNSQKFNQTINLLYADTYRVMNFSRMMENTSSMSSSLFRIQKQGGSYIMHKDCTLDLSYMFNNCKWVNDSLNLFINIKNIAGQGFIRTINMQGMFMGTTFRNATNLPSVIRSKLQASYAIYDNSNYKDLRDFDMSYMFSNINFVDNQTLNMYPYNSTSGLYFWYNFNNNLSELNHCLVNVNMSHLFDGSNITNLYLSGSVDQYAFGYLHGIQISYMYANTKIDFDMLSKLFNSFINNSRNLYTNVLPIKYQTPNFSGLFYNIHPITNKNFSFPNSTVINIPFYINDKELDLSNMFAYSYGNYDECLFSGIPRIDGNSTNDRLNTSSMFRHIRTSGSGIYVNLQPIINGSNMFADKLPRYSDDPYRSTDYIIFNAYSGGGYLKNYTDASYMFANGYYAYMSYFQSVISSSMYHSYNTRALINVSHMFYNSKFNSIGIPTTLNFSHVDDASGLFESTLFKNTGIFELDLANSVNNGGLTNMKNMHRMFYNSGMLNLNCNSMSNTYHPAKAQQYAESPNVIAPVLTDISECFSGTNLIFGNYDYYSYKGLTFSHKTTPNLVNMAGLFENTMFNSYNNCASTNNYFTIRVEYLPYLTDMSRMFKGTRYNASKVPPLISYFYGLENVTNISSMFENSCGFNSAKVTGIRKINDATNFCRNYTYFDFLYLPTIPTVWLTDNTINEYFDFSNGYRDSQIRYITTTINLGDFNINKKYVNYSNLLCNINVNLARLYNEPAFCLNLSVYPGNLDTDFNFTNMLLNSSFTNVNNVGFEFKMPQTYNITNDLLSNYTKVMYGITDEVTFDVNEPNAYYTTWTNSLYSIRYTQRKS